MTAWYEESFGAEYLQLYAHRDQAEAAAHVRAIQALLDPPQDEPLLDLCCGGGRVLVALWQAGFRHLAGLDLSADLLQAAAGALRRVGVPHVLVSGEPALPTGPDRCAGGGGHAPSYQGAFSASFPSYLPATSSR